MKVTFPAILVGLLVGGAVSFGFGVLDGLIVARGGQPLGWTMRVGVGTALGVVTMAIVGALSGNRALAFAGAADDKLAKTFQPDPQRGIVYVFRDAFVGKLVGLDVLVDGALEAQMRGKTFVKVALAPGSHTLSSVQPGQTNRADLTVSVAAGSLTYVEQAIKMGALQSGPSLALRDEKNAQPRVRRCRLLATAPGQPARPA
jgi:hypothetical protein